MIFGDGELGGLKVSLDAADQKLAQMRKLCTRTKAVDLPLAALRPVCGRWPGTVATACDSADRREGDRRVSPASGDVWRLVRDEQLLGEIVIENADFPWLSGRFLPQPAFAEVKPLFDQELALVESGLDDADAWERIYNAITDSVTLLSPHGPVPEFLLHIQGDEAWFRWNDEPFGGG